jgi:tetratricopeptide (TPR) repeat protein
MNEEQIKEQLLEWLNKPFNDPSFDFSEALLHYPGSDETVLGAKLFLVDNNSNYKLLHQRITGLKFTDVKKTNITMFRYAASIVFLIGIIGIYYIVSTRNSYDEFKVVEEGLPVFMSESKANFDGFMNQYRIGNYKDAISIGNKLNKDNNDTLNFYIGCSYSYNKNYDEAVAFFEKISSNSKFYCNSLYQKAFVYSQIDNKDSVIVTLNSLLKADCPFYYEKGKLFKRAIAE